MRRYFPFILPCFVLFAFVVVDRLLDPRRGSPLRLVAQATTVVLIGAAFVWPVTTDWPVRDDTAQTRVSWPRRSNLRRARTERGGRHPPRRPGRPGAAAGASQLLRHSRRDRELGPHDGVSDQRIVPPLRARATRNAAHCLRYSGHAESGSTRSSRDSNPLPPLSRSTLGFSARRSAIVHANS